MKKSFILGFAIIKGKQTIGLITDKFETLLLGKFIRAEAFVSPNGDNAVFVFTKEDWSQDLYFVENHKVIANRKNLHNVRDFELGVTCAKWGNEELSGLLGWDSNVLIPFEYDSVSIPNYNNFAVIRKNSKSEIIRLDNSKVLKQPRWKFDFVCWARHEELGFLFGCSKGKSLYIYDGEMNVIDKFDIEGREDDLWFLETYDCKKRSIEGICPFPEENAPCNYVLTHNNVLGGKDIVTVINKPIQN